MGTVLAVSLLRCWNSGHSAYHPQWESVDRRFSEQAGFPYTASIPAASNWRDFYRESEGADVGGGLRRVSRAGA